MPVGLNHSRNFRRRGVFSKVTLLAMANLANIKALRLQLAQIVSRLDQHGAELRTLGTRVAALIHAFDEHY
jgi:hypothetical protein